MKHAGLEIELLCAPHGAMDSLLNTINQKGYSVMFIGDHSRTMYHNETTWAALHAMITSLHNSVFLLYDGKVLTMLIEAV